MRPSLLLLLSVILAACSTQQVLPLTATETNLPPSTSTSTPIPLSPTITPQRRLSPVTYGPELERFPANVNPLTGREVLDSSLLKLPAVLVSISNMPFTARPQAGPGFASWVYELYIGEGATRFMSVFYGEYPRTIPNISGDCAVRDQIIHPSSDWIGNRVWLDENANGQQDPWEAGVGGVCVRLIEASSREVQQESVTDSNGYYAFNASDVESILQFQIPSYYRFTKPNVGDDDRDSDAESNGETPSFKADSIASYWDAGLILAPCKSGEESLPWRRERLLSLSPRELGFVSCR